MRTPILVLSLIAVAWCNLCAQTPAAPSKAPSPAKSPFRHPGLFTSREELDFIKAKVTARKEPWFSAFTAMQKSPVGNLDFKPNGGKPFVQPVLHASFRDKAYNVNTGAPWADSRAAYCQALLWYMTGNQKYAKNAAEILNTYAAITDLSGKEKLDQHLLVGSFWCMGFLQAAEILKHTSKVWPESEQKKFAESLRNVWLPTMKDFAPAFNGNWDAAITATMMAMGVYLDDQALFDRAVNYYQKGPDLKTATDAEPFWQEMARFHPDLTPNGSLPYYLGLNWSPDHTQPGWTQETERDHNANSHEQGGVHAFVQSAEIAWHQGVDLYGMLDNRLLHAVEGVAKRATEWQKQFPINITTSRYVPFFEMPYNHYHNRKGLPMPNVGAVLNLPGYRPELSRQAYSPNIFGTLTCYGVGETFKSMPPKP